MNQRAIMPLILCFMSVIIAPHAAISAPRILAIGDSLTEGYGVEREQAYPALLQKALRENGYPKAEVINAGTSGATSAFGARTLRFHLKRAKPDLLILALGANDALRGLKISETEKHIDETIKLAKDNGIKVLLAGMQAPPNYGQKFPKDFAAIFPRLAKKHDVTLIPFLLEGVAGEAKLNLADGIHPNPEGYRLIAKNLLVYVKGAL